MGPNTFFTFFLLLTSTLSFGQGRIEILVNDRIQKITNQAIPVSKADDKIELRIYPENSQKRTNLIDSLKTEGCGIKGVYKRRIVFLPPKGQQQSQSSSTRLIEKKYDAINYKKPEFKASYYSFSFTVDEITGCKGSNFFLIFIFNDRISDLKRYKEFISKYKFIYIL